MRVQIAGCGVAIDLVVDLSYTASATRTCNRPVLQLVICYTSDVVAVISNCFMEIDLHWSEEAATSHPTEIWVCRSTTLCCVARASVSYVTPAAVVEVVVSTR